MSTTASPPAATSPTTTTTTSSSHTTSLAEIPPQQTSAFAQKARPHNSAPMPLTLPNVSALSCSSDASSPTATSPPQLAMDTSNTSLQPSPEGPQGRMLSTTSSTNFQLPDAAIPTSSGQSAMSDAVAMSKGSGLIRRISRGAASRLSRRRPSTNKSSNRDKSSGPAILRRRSDSHGALDKDRDDTDLAGGDPDEEAIEDIVELHPVESNEEKPRSILASDAGTSLVNVAGVGPVVPAILKNGTFLTKVTKRKRKQLKFVLDLDSAKVYWNADKPSKRFYIDDIKEIRVAADARNYREEFSVPADCEPRWITILYADDERNKGRSVKTVHIIASDEHLFKLWTTTLENIWKYRIDMMSSLAEQRERSIKAHWNREMARIFASQPRSIADKRLSVEEVEVLCRSLHIYCSKAFMRAQFAAADKDQTGSLDFTGFKEFIKRLKGRDDIAKIYDQIASDPSGGLSFEEFLSFVKDTQKVNIDANLTKWEENFENFSKKSKCSGQATPAAAEEGAEPQPLRIKLPAFTAYLASTDNPALLTESQSQKLERPLNEYFISSSHNTYLLGRQVAGESSTEPYITALQRGCRCVEVDCWDGTDGRPVVMHGRTLTTKVLFSDCITAICKNAFLFTHYPLVISLEVHCCAEQQIIMAKILKRCLGDALLVEPLMTNSLSLPSPEDLKHRILIKVKTGEWVEEGTAMSDISAASRSRSTSSPIARPVALDNAMVNYAPLPGGSISTSPSERSSSIWSNDMSRQPQHITNGTVTSNSSATDDSDGREGAASKKKRKVSKIVKPLGDLGVYFRGHKFTAFGTPESRSYNHVFSFSERTFESLCKDSDTKSQLDKHNMRYLTRVYPSGYRINSSNFDPNKFWRRGAQMVALNWQTYDLAVQMNDAMFAAGSDRTGYVLKPDELRQSRQLALDQANGGGCLVKKEKKLVRFTIKIISAQQLPRPWGMGAGQDIDPYIEFETFCADDKARGVAVGKGGQDASARNGMSGIGSPHRRRTKIVQKNGFNPVFDDELTVSLETKFPSLIFVRWTVWNSADGRSYGGDKNRALATFTAKLSSLQEGYRHIPLFNNNGEQFLFSTLFCKINKEESLSVQREDLKFGKVEALKQIGRSVFSRNVTPERKSSTEDH